MLAEFLFFDSIFLVYDKDIFLLILHDVKSSTK
jgi:hypothetical protein